MQSYRLVAESLVGVSVPPVTIPGTPGETDQPTAGITRDCGPEFLPEPPRFLAADQVESWRRVMVSLAGWDAAVLAEPVGHGKSWVALAVASALGCRVAVIAPAALRAQWQQCAANLKMAVPVTSLELVSRGRLPHRRTRLVIIDEAHRLRHWNTRRVAHLAPWLPGRKVLLVTGTPIVNSPGDLVAILRLAVADDALRLDGIQSLEAIAAEPRPPAALRRLVIRGVATGTGIRVARRVLRCGKAESDRADRAVTAITRLRLGNTAAIARMIRHLLLDSAASSDAAWYLAARRYRRLLLHSRDAGGVSRKLLKQLLGPSPDQTVMWSLLGEFDSGPALPTGDIPVLDDILSLPELDGEWMDAVAGLLSDRIPTLCFARYLATARALRIHLGGDIGWATGQSAGIGLHQIDRAAVLNAFGPERSEWRTLKRLPTHLILTEIGAEGLNLQGAKRVLHLDLPWHAIGKAQRLGRVVRRGQSAPSVEEWVRRPAAAIGRALGHEARVERKGLRARTWMEAISGINEPTPFGCIGDLQRVAVVVLRAGTREGSLALGQDCSGWRVIDRESVLQLVASGDLTMIDSGPGAKSEDDNGLGPAIDQAIRPAIVPRPRQVAAVLAAARLASRNRDSTEVARLGQLLAAVRRSHQLGVQRRFDERSPAELLRSAPIHFPDEPTARVQWHGTLVPTMTGVSLSPA